MAAVTKQSKRLRPVLKWKWALLLVGLILILVLADSLHRSNHASHPVVDQQEVQTRPISPETKPWVVQQQPSEGWHTIQVFYGSDKLLDASKYVTQTDSKGREWFSQARQDQVVAGLFREQHDLYYVELAANNAAYLSNSLGLERNLQWKGLCIEANPQYWHGLSYRDCTVVAAAVGKHRMEQVKFNFAGEETGGIISRGGHDGSDFKSQGNNPKVKTLYTVPFVEILERNKAPFAIDYLSLDVEGAEHDVMEAFPFDQYIIKVMSVERPPRQLQELLLQKGFKAVSLMANFGETLWVHTSVMNELDLEALKHFDLPIKQPGFGHTVKSTFVTGAYIGS